MPVKAILTDIEGTTSAVSFVFDVLFPYAREHLPDFVRNRATEPAVAEQIEAVRGESGEPDANIERIGLDSRRSKGYAPKGTARHGLGRWLPRWTAQGTRLSGCGEQPVSLA